MIFLKEKKNKRNLLIFYNFSRCQFTKYNNVLWVNILILCPSLENSTTHITIFCTPLLESSQWGDIYFEVAFLYFFARAKVPIEIHRYIKIRMLLRKSFTLCQMAGRLVQGILLLSGKLWAFGFCFRFLVHWPIIVVTKRLNILSMVRHK